MDTDYGARYRGLYERHWWWRARERVILDALREHRPPNGGLRAVLDVGCGDGLFFDALLALEDVEIVEGVEPEEALVSANGPHRNRIRVTSFDADFEPGRRYSAVLMLDVLEHLADPEAALRHALSLLEPGGIVLATVPAFMSLWTQHDDLNHHYTRYRKRTFGALAAAAGMRIDEARYFFRWTVPAKLATRLIEAIRRGEPVPATVPAAPINRTLYLLSRLEARLIGRVGVPFGSSLLVVGAEATAVRREARGET